MLQPEDSPSLHSASIASDALFQQQVERLYRLTVQGRWLFIASLWLTVGTASLWGLRYPISLILDYFTWAAVWYGLIFNRFSAIGLVICLSFTIAVLVWQSRNLLLGLPERDRKWLELQVQHIRQQGPSHPLWKRVCDRSSSHTKIVSRH